MYVGPLGTNFSETLFEIHRFSFKKMNLKLSSAKWQPFLSRPQCVNSITIQRLYNSKFLLFIPNKPFLISQYMVSWPHIYTYIFIHIHIIKYCTDAHSIPVTVESTITRSNKRYCTHHCRQKINQRLKTHKRHPTPRPVGRGVWCLLWIYCKKLTAL